MRSMALAIVFCVSTSAFAAEVTLSAGKHDRSNAIAWIKLPEGSKGTAVSLKSGGERLGGQVVGDRAVLIVPAMKAGESKTYSLEVLDVDGARDALANREGTNIKVQLGGKNAFTYNGEKTPLPQGFEPAFARGGYIFPVRTPSGKSIADDYPPKHKHHHGIWMPWTKTKFEDREPDFWNMGQKKGTVEFVELGGNFSGMVAAGFSTKHRFVDLLAKPDPKPALNETWEVIAYSVTDKTTPYFVFDLVSTQTCAGDSPLILPKYHYGGIGFRGHREWDGKANATFLTSEGKTRENGNETRGRWAHISGKVDGAVAGIAVLDHPRNFRHPQPLRLHPDEPFLCYAPQQLGEFKIEPGKPYVSRYRFVVSDGPANKELLDRLWADYAEPIEATVK